VHVARDHMTMTDMRRCAPTEQESRALFETAMPLFQETGKTLLYGSRTTWFLRADDWSGLHTSTPDAAAGRNIDIWMPKGEGERAWRRLQNEVQMEWHENAVNTAREQQRLPAINSLWLWGGTDIGQPGTGKEFASSDKTLGETGMLASTKASATLESVLRDQGLLVLDELSESALAEEWGIWLERMHALEKTWFAPLLNALQTGQLAQINLIVGHNAQLREFSVSKTALYKFWAKPSLSRLLP
jgi:hypothetical protein